MSKADAKDSVEWLDWDQAMRVLRAAKVGVAPYRTLIDWCGQGLVEAKVATLTGNGEVRRDVALEPAFWRLCRYQDGPSVDPLDGSIAWTHADAETKDAQTATMMGPRFRKDQLLSVVAHVDQSEVEAALVEKGGWLDGKQKDSSGVEPAKAKSAAGKPPERERWQAFYFAVIELAKDGRLTGDHFSSAAALSEEIADMMGDGAFNPDHVKRVVGQVFKRFCKE